MQPVAPELDSELTLVDDPGFVNLFFAVFNRDSLECV
jgi:hypothetical protein